MEIYIYIITALLGLAVGSFLNVVIYRVPRGKFLQTRRSVCPKCNRELKWYQNIPLLSFMILKGRCAFCHEKISWRYPLVEFVNAVFYVYFYWQLGLSVNLFVFAFLSSVLLVIFFIDLDYQIIPDVVTLPGMIIGLVVALLPGGIGIIPAVVGFLVGGGALYLIALLGDWLFKKESMGGGDIKMAAMLGAFLGWQKVLLVFISSAFIGLIVSLVIMLFSVKLRRQRVVPFGPFLALAAMLAILYGDWIINYYLSNFLQIH